MRVLITCGPTWMAIDDVRVVSNRSSGEMGHLIAAALLKQKVQVTLIEGPVTHQWVNKKVKVIKFYFFDELASILKQELKKDYDIVIHAAAVSDFKVTKVVKGKVSSARSLSLKLIPAPKLINNIKKIAPQVFLVGFKLEPHLKVEHILKETQGLFKKAQCDLVVANSLDKGYQGLVVNQEGKILAKAANKKALTKALVKLLTQGRTAARLPARQGSPAQGKS